MEIKVVNKGDGIKAFQHLGSVVSLAPGETFNSNLDFTVAEKQVIASQPELEYTNSEQVAFQASLEEVETKKPEPKKEKEEKVEEVKPEAPAVEEEVVEEAEVEVEAKPKKKSSKK